MITRRAKDGREIIITDNLKEYDYFVSVGRIVFTSKEMRLATQFKATPEGMLRLLDVKQIFRGATLSEVKDDTLIHLQGMQAEKTAEGNETLPGNKTQRKRRSGI